MRLPLSWLQEYAAVELSADDDAGVAEMSWRLTNCGLEVESVETVGHDITGVIVGEVLGIEELTGFNKPIRYCHVSAGDGQERHVICGAGNFVVGDRVPLALPGSVLPGGFEIGARKIYGRVSEGMICSPAELGIGDDHTGIMVLAPDAPLGADFVSYAGLRDVVFDINVTPDKGFALSVRGVARELAISYAVPFTDPAGPVPSAVTGAGEGPGGAYPARIEDPTGCDRFVLREVLGVDPSAPTPLAMAVRLARSGQRSVSLAVDVTNYLMLELGQPLHAYDKAQLVGAVVVRRARPGEKLETIDHVVRELDAEDILIADDSGPIGLAGTMGGVHTEVSESTSDVVIEAGHFSARGVARMSRRHRLGSEASARFERGVDTELQRRASARAAAMLAEHGGGRVVPGCTYASVPVEPITITMDAGYPDRVAGVAYGTDTVTARLRDVGCTVASASGDRLIVSPPSWRPDITDPADLAEEVIRLEGYQNIPVHAVRAAGGRGLTGRQRLRRATGRALAYQGFVEVTTDPFASAADFDRLQLPADDARRLAVRLSNPLSDDEPLMRTTLLPGLMRTLARNVGRGFSDVLLFEFGLVFRPRPDGASFAPILPVDRSPSASEIAQLEAALPDQPLHAGVVLAGNAAPAGWWGPGRPAGWQDAIEAARTVLRASRVRFAIRTAHYEPWHPGRCAAVVVQDCEGREQVVAHAGELHPRVIAAFGLPVRSAAMELDLSVVEAAADALGPRQARPLSSYPVAVQDVALIVAQAVPAAKVESALRVGAAQAGDVLLEDLSLFDVYTGDQAGEGHKSLAYTLRFRAPDRTLTAEEVAAARDAAVAEAVRQTGAVLRSG